MEKLVMVALETEWGEPFELDAIYESWDDFLPRSPGVYVLMRQNRTPRLGGADESGVLYVGKTRNLRGRLWAFWGGNTHTAGSYLYSNPDIASCVLGFRCSDQKDVEREMGKVRGRVAYPIHLDLLDRAEQAVLGTYVRQYGELPPLNFSFPGKYGGPPTKAELRWARRGLGIVG